MPRCTVIKLTQNEVKVLQVSKTKKKDLTLDYAFAVDLSDLGNDEDGVIQRGARIREAIKRNKMPVTPCGIIIPKQSAIVRTTTLPSSDANEIREMAQFEAEKYIPFNTERHIISNSVLHTDGVEGSHVLISAVDGPVMDAVLTITQEARLEPVVAEVSSVALVRAFSHYEHEALEKHAILLLNIGKDQADISILKDGMMVAARSNNLGTDQLDKAVEKAGIGTDDAENAIEIQDVAAKAIRGWINKMVRFTAQTYDFAAREHGIGTNAVLYISGEGSTLQGLDKALAESLGLEVHLFNPMPKLPLGDGVDKSVLIGCIPALGTALRLVEEEENPRLRGDRINLLPPSVIEHQEASERKVLLMISGTMVLITLVLLYLAFDAQARHGEELRDRYSSFIKKMEPTIEDLEKKREQLEIIHQITSDRAGVLEILDRISAFPGMGSTKDGGVLTLDGFKYSVRNEVTFEGTAINFEDMQRFADFLERMTVDGKPVFNDVGLPQPKPVDLSAGRGTVYAFSITCILNELSGRRSEDG